jgi:hypothetical protein
MRRGRLSSTCPQPVAGICRRIAVHQCYAPSDHQPPLLWVSEFFPPPRRWGDPPPQCGGPKPDPLSKSRGGTRSYMRATRDNVLKSSADRDRFEAFSPLCCWIRIRFALASSEALISCAGRVGRPIDSARNLGPLRFRAPTLPSRDKSRTIAVCRTNTARSLLSAVLGSYHLR